MVFPLKLFVERLQKKAFGVSLKRRVIAID